MVEKGLYTVDVGQIGENVGQAGMTGFFARSLA
jgi:hypothetical protein